MPQTTATDPEPASAVPPLLRRASPGELAGLRSAKRLATGFLLGAALLFLVSLLLPGSTATGFVRAAAEAGMVGGLADWFAVTALFRHPLGVPVPHTALIPRQKDALATKLGEFVTGNFLTADAVGTQVAEADLVGRTARRLAGPELAARVGEEAAGLVSAALGAVDPRQLTDLAVELVRRDLARRSYTPVLGQLLARAVQGRAQAPLVDLAVARAHDALRAHREALHPVLKQWIEDRGLVGLLFATDKRVDSLLDGAVQLLGEIRKDPAHPVRGALDELLDGLVDDLRYDAATALSVDSHLRRMLDDVHVQRLVHDLIADVTTSLRTSLSERGGDLPQRLADLVRHLAARVADDAELRGQLEQRLQSVVRYAVEHYGDHVVALISRTVGGWEGRDAAARIEEAVGRDLQFIRINGTVVGALAGVAIHAVGLVVA